MSEQKPSQLSVELRDKIVSRHRSGKGYQNISAEFKVPKNTLASIILKWKKFRTSKTLPRAGSPAQFGQLGEKGLGKGGAKNPIVTLTELQSSSVEMGEPFRRTTISAALYHSGLYDRGARRKEASPQEGNMTARLEDSQIMRNKTLCSDETKFEFFGLNAKRHVWRKPRTIPYGEAWWWQHHDVGMFFSSRDWETSQDRGKDEWSIKRSLITTCSRVLSTSDWRDQKIAVQQRSPSNLTELQRICREEWEKLPKYKCAKLVSSHPRRPEAVIAAKVDSTKYC
uniref:Sleeping Beauty transposase HTH domain-containing protein n=1 Tax=Oncorhynchus kisutch TaxID=8019 RepID=A0A8C7MUW6_ONCKI